ncbi:cytochrome P450 domain-containing protein [Rhizoctonia solani AG-1 IA]|uniref:Cytochrome P450 domain-containing protein n=1 Tax=Thanatephorus cucumeris (strain AG1-IA) TaxID=983506 RepID=L8WPQ1_THACA|nr:cytochrome P450 domain-containing protein [Rhizoctonia solani AG-1 IA]
MVVNPDVQVKAQQELDSVLGHATLPKMSDKNRLPYIRNVIDEVFRLYPVLPMGEVGFNVKEVGLINLHTIRTGAITSKRERPCKECSLSHGAIGRDPCQYKDPETFDPDRFLDPQVLRPSMFGWGRR